MGDALNEALLILFVRDQSVATEFYRRVLEAEPRLEVPGMTEFQLTEHSALGLMPEAGIQRLLGDRLRSPQSAAGIPRAELYLRVGNPGAYHQRALDQGATEQDRLCRRDWGDDVAYSTDLDGHLLAFASSPLST